MERFQLSWKNGKINDQQHILITGINAGYLFLISIKIKSNIKFIINFYLISNIIYIVLKIVNMLRQN